MGPNSGGTAISDSEEQIEALHRLHFLMSQVNAREDVAEVLQMIADGVVDVVGFQVAAISAVRPDGRLVVVAVAGDDSARDVLMGTVSSVEEFDEEFAVAERWGILRFVAHDKMPATAPLGWIPDLQPIASPDAWHPLDALFAPLTSPSGDLVGMLSVDVPRDGLRPRESRWQVLEMYAVQAGIAINNAQERNRLEEQVRLDGAIHEVVEIAGRRLDLDGVIDDCVAPVVEGLRCSALWVRAFDGQGERPGLGRGAHHPDSLDHLWSEASAALARRLAAHCWHTGNAVLVAGDSVRPPDWPLSQAELDEILRIFGRTNATRLLFVPLGAGPECLGYLTLARNNTDAAWSQPEVDAVLQIGRDLGRAVLHARLFEREQRVVEELKQLDKYKSELVATISHELKNPLTSIIGNLELLQDQSADTLASLAAIQRNTERLERLVENLLLLGMVSDPTSRFNPEPVDMLPIIESALRMFEPSAAKKRLELRLHAGEAKAVAWGDPDQLERAVHNIISNAVKFSTGPGSIDVRLSRHRGELVFECTDTGLGLSEDDQRHLFEEFFRSHNTAALEVPGTGLGLSIVKRIVERHGGTIRVSSVLGEGSTFAFTLPTGGNQ